jgi:hypothetical protein
MRVPRICVYWLLLFSLLGIDSCTGGGVHKKTIPTNCDATAKNCAVRIDADCSAHPDPADVVPGYTVTWGAPDTTYSVQFLKAKTPFQPSTGKVTVVLAGSPSKPVTGDNSCGTPPNLPPSANNTGCYFYYDVFHDNKECSDPGIHVVN